MDIIDLNSIISALKLKNQIKYGRTFSLREANYNKWDYFLFFFFFSFLRMKWDYFNVSFFCCDIIVFLFFG